MLGKKIKQLRLQNNWSQEEFGKRIHHTKSNVSKWENETTTPDVETLKRIAEVLNVKVDFLLADESKEVLPEPTHPTLRKKLIWQIVNAAIQTSLYISLILGFFMWSHFANRGGSYSLTDYNAIHYEQMQDNAERAWGMYELGSLIGIAVFWILGIVNAAKINKITGKSTILVVFSVLILWFGHLIVACLQFKKFKKI